MNMLAIGFVICFWIIAWCLEVVADHLASILCEAGMATRAMRVSRGP